MSPHGGRGGANEYDGNDFLHRLSLFIDKHITTINYSIYFCGGIGICVILYSIRVHKRFTCVSQVPNEFIQKHFKLRGQVQSVHNDHLLVDHKPIISLTKSTVPKPLKIHLAGVEYNKEGVQFLEEQALKKQVWFRLIQFKGHDGINCTVSTRKSMFKVFNLNEEILHRGYGKVVPLMGHSSDAFTLRLMQRLLQAEMYAEKKRKGLWKGEETSYFTSSIVGKAFRNIFNIFKKGS
ncbi:protein C3orf33 homolog [Antedon mediterranea]|uniref:protein C3orf33 homolog n=1 Tax=Antedon mediterranea TaxID=105859 RepID=UPI003AF88038